MTQIARVLQAIDAGAKTSLEVEAVTHLPLKHCSAYLRTLETRGIIHRIGGRRYNSGRIAIEWSVSMTDRKAGAQ